MFAVEHRAGGVWGGHLHMAAQLKMASLAPQGSSVLASTLKIQQPESLRLSLVMHPAMDARVPC